MSLTCTWNRAQSPFCHFDVRVLATGTYRPGSGCCTSCTRLRRPLCVQTPLRPRPPSRDELASRPRTRRTAPAAKRTTDKHTHRMNHCSIAAQSPLQRQRGGGSWDRPDALTTMSSSVTRGCRLFTVIFVPSKGLTTGWGDTRHCVITPTDSNQLKYEETLSILVVYGT